MLSLSRFVGEKIKIGHDITLTVVEIRKGEVRLAIDAPADVVITRAEVRRYLGPLPKPTTGDVVLPDPSVEMSKDD